MKFLTFVLGVLVSSILHGEDIRWDVHVSEHGWAMVTDTHQGKHSLSEAIALVPKGIWLKHFRTYPSREDAELQMELRDYLTLKYPELHTEALSSAGNMHNPKVVALREAFQEALMSSRLVNNINSSLKSRCERITSASFEKFTIIEIDGQPTYSAMVWFNTEKCT